MLWRRLISGIRTIFHRDAIDRDLDDELREYVQMSVDRNLAAGMSPEEARRAARAELGSLESVKERVWDVGWESIAESMLQDVRYGVRMLTRNLRFTAVAGLALALGIGVNTVVFTAYKAMVARPIDARDPGEMVNLALARQTGLPRATFSYPDYEAYRDSVRAFRGLIAYTVERLTLSNAGDPVSQRASASDSAAGRLGLLSPGTGNAEFASTYAVSENYFTVLGVAVVRGRGFESMGPDELRTSPPVLVSENYWQRRFGGDPALVGRTIRLNGADVTVIGVTPRDFVGTGVAVPDFWMPIGLEPIVHANDRWLTDRENQQCRMFARLAPGATSAQAQAEMTSLADHLRALHDPHAEAAKPAAALVWPASPFPLPIDQYAGLTTTILLIMAAAAMVLVVACANVGSLQLARARSRQHELHTRLSLGATRLRVIRQLLTESALLGLVSGVTALLFSWGMLKVAVRLVADFLPPEYGTLIFNVTPDLGIFAYMVAISFAAGMLFGLAPAMESSRAALASTVRTSTSPARSRRLQDVLVAAQVALSLVLLIAGSLLVRSAMRSLSTSPGYDSTRVVNLNVQFPEASRYTTERKVALVRELRARLAALPGVASTTSAQPPAANVFQTPAAAVDEVPSSRASAPAIVHYTYAQAGYFQTLGVPILIGHGFASDAAPAGPVVVLSESAARQFWPDKNPIGRRLRLGAIDERLQNVGDLTADGPACEVIGVARDARGVLFNGGDSRQLYLPLPDDRVPGRPILIRTDADPAPVMKAIEPLVASINPDLLITSSTLDDQLRRSGPFFVSSLSAAVALTVGLVGLLLALMGIHGTVSYVVVLRTREVGIRMAIGAQRRDILGLILRESTRPVLAGLLAGMALAVGVSYLLRGVLFGLGTVDVLSFAGVSIFFLAIALIAAYGPSRRASTMNPVAALRYE